jgi:endonuclease-3
VLTAQSTENGVPRVTPLLFARCPAAAALAAIDRASLEEIIRPTGFFRQKAASLQGIAEALVGSFDGQVPHAIDQLTTLPGVGRKTANVVRGHAFGLPGITADTHVMRVSRRLGWTAAVKPEDVEHDLNGLFPEAEWTMVSDVTIFHGRRCCHAKKPACGACPLGDLCPSYGEGPTDPAEAKTLVKTS